MATKLRSGQARNRAALPNIGSLADATLDTLLAKIDTEFDAPLRLHASIPADAILNFSASSVVTADGAYKSVPPLSNQILAVPTSTINFQTQATTGATFDITWPTPNTLGFYRRAGFTLLASGNIQVLFSDEAVSLVALANPGALLIEDGIPLGYIDLVCTNAVAGYFKGASSVTSIIENVDIKRFGSGAGGSGSGGIGEVFSYVQENMGRDSWPYSHAAWCDFAKDKETKTDITSTAIFDVVSKNYKFPVGTEFLLTNEMLDADFLASGVDISEIKTDIYTANGLVPTLTVSRNGVDFQAVTLIRDGLTNLYQADYLFTDEVANSFSRNITSALSDISGTVLNNSLVLANSAYIKTLDLVLTKTLAPSGYVLLTIKDVSSNILFSKSMDAALLVTGTNTIDVAVVLPAGTYTVGLIGDTLYTASYPANKLALNTNGITVNGRLLSLKMRVSGATGLFIEGLACYFGSAAFVGEAESSVAARVDVLEDQTVALGYNAAQPYVLQDYVAVANTTIQNRAPVSASLKAVGPVERIPVRGISKSLREFGANGESVYEIDNKDARVRLVGSSWYNGGATNGNHAVSGANITDYIEVRFFGTGVNIAGLHFGRTFVASVDGGAEGANLVPASLSNVLGVRNYTARVILPVTSGLTLGWHTVKIRNTSVAQEIVLSDIEILNETSSLTIVQGTAVNGRTQETLGSVTQSAFKEGIVGTKGGRVIKYLQDGQIKSAVREVDATALYLTNADHTNEEVDRVLNWREFGVQRADDLSTLAGVASNRTFTTEDNLHTITGYQVRDSGGVLTGDNVNCPTTITFVGCGIDLLANGTFTAQTFVLDGVGLGVVTRSLAGQLIYKIASGLPYGTHTLQYFATGGSSAVMADFITYKPKAPVVPTGAIPIADYNVLANYSQLTSLVLSPFRGTISQGVLRKTMTREAVFVGAWSFNAVDTLQFNSGWNLATSTSGNYYELTFIGTGIEIGTYAYVAVLNNSVTIDSNSNLSGYTCNLVQSGTGLTFTPATGALTGTPSANMRYSLRISGLAFGIHKVRIQTNAATNGLYADTIDIITPIVYNNPKLGNQSLKDLRNFSPIPYSPNGIDLSKAKAWVKFDGNTQRILASYGISQVLRTANGSYWIYFSRRFKSAEYFINASSNNYSIAMSTSTFPNCMFIMAFNSSDVLADSVIHLSFFGELENESDPL